MRAWLILSRAGRQVKAVSWPGVVARPPTALSTVLLAEARYIHRVNTAGGVAPSTGCTSTSQIGVFTMVPYSADYIFHALRGTP